MIYGVLASYLQLLYLIALEASRRCVTRGLHVTTRYQNQLGSHLALRTSVDLILIRVGPDTDPTRLV
ncbi:hypothetical protein ACJBU6_11512 [Exserohilum turcicum]